MTIFTQTPARRAGAKLFVPVLLVVLSAFCPGMGRASIPTPGHAHVTRDAWKTSDGLQGVRVPFIENRGQVDARVAFYARTFAGTAFVTRQGALVLSLPATKAAHGHASAKRAWALVERPVGATRLKPVGGQRSPTHVSVFKGIGRKAGHSDLTTFQTVRVGEAWPGVSYEIRAHGRNVERVFTVAPMANPHRIRMHIAGSKGLELLHGALVAETGNGPVALSRPVAYQRINGERVPVNVAYVVDGDSYGFRLGHYDHSKPVTIDPLIQSTYLGGSDFDEAKAVAVAANGEVYVAGRTKSTDFPGISGGAVTTENGSYDVFVSRFTPGLDTLIQSTYLGASDATGLAIRSDGDVYLAGTAVIASLPGAPGGAQPTSGGSEDGFVTLFSNDLKTVIQSTYLGGSGMDDLYAMALGPAGNLYVAGDTNSSDFPGTSGGYESSLQSSTFEAIVAEFSPDLTSLLHATYLGSADTDTAYALQVAGNGDVYVAGDTSGTFPGTAGGAQATAGGGGDAFVASLSPDLGTLEQASYYGGAASETGRGLSLGTDGSIYLAGTTMGSANLPGATGGALPQRLGDNDAFVAKLTPDLKTIVQATYLGGSYVDNAKAVAVAADGRVYVAGYTYSSDFYDADAGVDPTAKGNGDGFVAVLSGGLTDVLSSTYLGGTSNYQNDTSEQVTAVAFGPTNQIYAVGKTYSNDFPVTSGAAQPTKGDTSNADAFVVRFDDDLQPLKTPAIQNLADLHLTYEGSGTDDFTLVGTGKLQVTASSSDTGLIPDANITGASSCMTAGSCSLTVKAASGMSGQATITVHLADAYGQHASASFGVNVDALQKPALSGLSDITLSAGQSGKETFSISGTNTLTVKATSSNTTLLPRANITGASSCTATGSCTLMLTPVSGQTGTATVTVTVSDTYGQSRSGTFAFTVTAASASSGGSSGGGGALGPWFLTGLCLLVAWRVLGRLEPTGERR